MDIERALKRPYKDAKQVFLGGLIQLVPILNWANMGYVLRLSGVAGKSKTEEYHFGEDFKHGFMMFLLNLIYSIPLFIIIVIGVLIMFAKLIPEAQITGEFPWMYLLTTLGPLLVLFIFLAIFISVITPMAMMFYFKKKVFGDGLLLGEILRRTFTARFLLAILAAWGISIGYAIVFFIVMIPFMMIPFLGNVITFYLSALMGYLLLVTSYTLYGEVFLAKK